MTVPCRPAVQLAPATWFESNTADGSICSNPEDMCLYLQMLLQRGKGLLTPQSFEQLIHPLIATDDGTHGEHYGLGLFTSRSMGITSSVTAAAWSASPPICWLISIPGWVWSCSPTVRLSPSKISRYALASFQRARWRAIELPDFPEDKLDDADDYVGTYRCGEKIIHADSKR